MFTVVLRREEICFVETTVTSGVRWINGFFDPNTPALHCTSPSLPFTHLSQSSSLQVFYGPHCMQFRLAAICVHSFCRPQFLAFKGPLSISEYTHRLFLSLFSFLSSLPFISMFLGMGPGRRIFFIFFRHTSLCIRIFPQNIRQSIRSIDMVGRQN